MKLNLKQKVFSWRERFFIKDEEGNDCYSVEGEIFSIGRKLHVKDAGGAQIAVMHQKVIALMPRFFVEIDGKEVCEIVKEFKLFKQNYRIEGLPWHLDGDFMGHEFTLNSSDGPIMAVTKKWFSWGDSYELDITDPKNVAICLCVVLALELVLQEEEQAESTTIETAGRFHNKK